MDALAELLAAQMQNEGITAYLDVGAPSTCPNIYYCTHFFASDPVVYLCHLNGGLEEYLSVSGMEVERASSQSRVEHVLSFSDVLQGRRGRIGEVAAALARKAGVKKLCVSPELPVGLCDGLRAEGFVLEVRESPFSALRKVKESGELECIQSCARTCEKACSHAIQMIRDSSVARDGTLVYEGEQMTSERLREEIDVVLLKGRCESAEGTIVACGSPSCVPHWIGEGKLFADEPIILDVFPRHKDCRYFSDLTRTVLRLHEGGSKVEKVKRMYAAVLDAQKAGIALMREGVKASQVHEEVRKSIISSGFHAPDAKNPGNEGFIHSTGHGVGLQIHEAPSIAPSDEVLAKGMVATVEPGLYYRGIGGVRIEDTLVVGEEGGRSVFSIPRQLTV